jgi:hypothetical protein
MFFHLTFHLPAVALRCSIKVAYQAADAGHPYFGESKLAAQDEQLRRAVHSNSSNWIRPRLALRKGHHLRKAPAFKRFDPNQGSIMASAHKASLPFHRVETQEKAGCAEVYRHY